MAIQLSLILTKWISKSSLLWGERLEYLPLCNDFILESTPASQAITVRHSTSPTT